MRYGTVNEEAAALEAIVEKRYPTMSAQDRSMFAAAVLYKVADLYRTGDTVLLHSYDRQGQLIGQRALVIEAK